MFICSKISFITLTKQLMNVIVCMNISTNGNWEGDRKAWIAPEKNFLMRDTFFS